MPLTRITTEINIPEGFEFDRMDKTTRSGDYNSDGEFIDCNIFIRFDHPQIILRKKKPKTRWFRAFKIKRSDGLITTDAYSTINGDQKQAIELTLLSRMDFAGWLTDWIEYEIE